jgi:hypothetical protein
VQVFIRKDDFREIKVDNSQSSQGSFLQLAGDELAFKGSQQHIWNPVVVSFPTMPRCHPKWKNPFHRRIYSLCNVSAGIFNPVTLLPFL